MIESWRLKNVNESVLIHHHRRHRRNIDMLVSVDSAAERSPILAFLRYGGNNNAKRQTSCYDIAQALLPMNHNHSKDGPLISSRIQTNTSQICNMNIISLFLLGIGASVAFANDASNNDKTQRLHQYFPSIQAFEEYT